MSKFEEMCKAFADCRKSYIDYQSRCFQHVSTLSTGFVKYCEVPQGHFAFVPAKDPDAEKLYTPLDAIEYGSDGYWHLGWRITLRESPNTSARRPMLVTLALRESEGGKIMVKRGWDQEAQELDLSSESQCQAFYDGVVERIEKYLGRNPQDIGSDARSSKIGFQVL